MKLPMLKAHINIVYATPLPYSPPMSRQYTPGSHHYFKTDLGLSWQFINGIMRTKENNPLRPLKGYLTAEISNIFNYGNLLSYSWILTDMDSTTPTNYYMIPNYLTPRMFNVKLRLDF